jgi:hypothetical protein
MKTLCLVFVLFFGFAGGVSAESIGAAVRVELHTDSGRMLPLYPVAASYPTWKAYAKAERGQEYRIIVRNQLNRRVGVVVAVDGRNIVSGKISWLAAHERMYILEPYGVGSFSGWRTTAETVNRFYFTSADNSYAAAFADRSALGVIAVAVYPEARPLDDVPAIGQDRSKAAGRCAPSVAAQQESVGTGFGQKEYAPVRIVAFTPETTAVEKIFLKYAWRSSLCRKGIIRCAGQNGTRNRLWDDGEGFAPSPPLWR